ncbi:protein MIZU-KUSSEI 1 [Cucumis sativus]|uniref:Protein MIZU-KUSSEI 1 n=1 Tax=Cucumis sativus TaxID=3659 RepID=A0A0A0LRZ1_CUCSA|nr:protein MIZU-KUSSEI 1 [Cucumis sativus]KGN63789.1 hypothetical protein Csa_013098 [Cucumis sativus]
MALESSSRRHFHWTRKVSNEDEEDSTFNSLESAVEEKQENAKPISQEPEEQQQVRAQLTRRKLQQLAISRFRSVLTALGRNRNSQHGLRSRVVGTLFGSRRGHVHFAFQRDPNSHPAFLIELATPISGLVKEMASGLVRIALECDKEKDENKKPPGRRLLEEPVWRTFCNGKKCGFASRRECGPKELKILKAVEPISMGAGVLPVNEDAKVSDEGESGSDGEIMYMRAKFERVVGSRDSEAFYMMNPDSNGAPELSIYLLRV